LREQYCGHARRHPLAAAGDRWTAVHRFQRELREVIAVSVAVAIVVVLSGFAAGLFSHKVKSRWCPRCGATTVALGYQQDAYASGLSPVGDARVQP
jgi:hypothetical protein